MQLLYKMSIKILATLALERLRRPDATDGATITQQPHEELLQPPLRKQSQNIMQESGDSELSLWFLSATNLPMDPFRLSQAVTVQDPSKFYESLRSDLALGPRGPRSRFGALENDLKLLRRICLERK